MDKKERSSIESSSQVKEEKRLNYTKFWAWGIGLLVALMAIAYMAGFITFGEKLQPTNDSEKKAYFEKDSSTSAAVATEEKMDTVKIKK